MNLKKLALFFTIMASLIFTMTISASAEFTDIDSENTALVEAVDALSEKGVIKGITQTQFGPGQPVTREEMAVFIYRMQKKGTLAKNNSSSPFKDVQNSSNLATITWAYYNGYINGISETEFNPNGPVSLADCYAMLVRMLGYEKKLPINYPDGYITIAEEIGLSENINKNADDELSRGDVAIILNNVLNKKVHPLDDKKILFIGNSHTYYGATVKTINWTVDEPMILRRFGDTGLFYKMCRQNGANITVDNWSWSGHSLADMFSGNCQNNGRHPGYDHLADLRQYSDMNYDYVVIQPQSRVEDINTHKEEIKCIFDIFREVNPDVEFIYSICPIFYTRSDELDKAFTDAIDKIADEFDLKVANWGKLIADMMSGVAIVENSTQEYVYNSFIVSKSASDGYHPNILSGYIQTQMIYSILSGEEAFGEDYALYADKALVEKILKDNYTYDNISDADSETKLKGDDLTNFPEIFKSKADMAGIQKLIDEYLKADNK